MADTDVNVNIGADASGVRTGVDKAKAALADFKTSVDALGASLSALGARLKDDVAGVQALTGGLGASASGVAGFAAQTTTALRSMQTAWAGHVEDQRKRLATLKHEWTGFVSPIVSSFNRGLLQMAEGAKSFAQVVRGFGQAVLQDILKVIDKAVTSWIVGEITKVAASRASSTAQVALAAEARTRTAALTAASNIAQIRSDAAAAVAAAYKAMAGIPPAPLWGVIASGAAYAGVLAFESLASAAGGFDIPAGTNPLTQLHAQEMVLPARIANPMRAMIDDYAAQRGGLGAPSFGGETHIHNYSVTAMDAASFKSFPRANKDPLSLVLQEMGRAGMRTA
jgi:hypothetical protein